MSRHLITLVMLLTLGLPFAANAQEACTLPVCDIPAKISELRSMNGDQRGMFALNMKAQYKDLADIAALNNILAFGQEFKAITKKDEDWVIRAVNDLSNTVVLNLAKFSAVDGAQLVAYYRQLDGQTSRYALITHWQGELNSIEDVATLEALTTFAAGARDRSTEVNDEDWVSRAATALITDITIKLTALDPAHEGVYSVAMTEASLALGTLNFDKMIVLDSSSSRNLVVVFVNSRLRVNAYTFNNVEIRGNELVGLTLSNGEIANSLSFTFDRQNGTVRGVIESTKNDAVEFTGQQTFSTRTVFAGKTPRALTKSDIIGKLKGEIAGVKGTLAIKSFMPNVYSATFTSESGSAVLSFQGKFFPKTGVLSLTSADKLKLMVSLREKNGAEVWDGHSFSLVNGTVGKATFAPIR